MNKFRLTATVDIEDWDATSAVESLQQMIDSVEDCSMDNWQVLDVLELTEEEI